jgi:NHL repeat
MRKALALASLMVVLNGGTAAAANHPFITSFGAFSSPESVATNAGGDIYVLDRGAGSIQKFDSGGEPVDFSALGSNEISGFSFDGPSAAEVAVAPAGAANGTAGDIYVASFAGIDVYGPDGTHLGQLTEANGEAFATEACGVAVDPAGDVYVAEFGGNVDRYAPAANPVANGDYDARIAGIASPCEIAVDASGAVYASTWPSGPPTRYDASQFGAATPSGTQLTDDSRGVAVDPANGDVYVAGETAIAQFDSGGEPLGSFGAARLEEPRGVAVAASGDVLVADAGAGEVAIFGPTPPPSAPAIVDTAPAAVTATEATLTASVNPDGDATAYRFEYGTDTSYGHSVPVPDAAIGGGEEPVRVSRPIAGLQPSTTYHFRVVATNSLGTTEGPDRTLTTFPAPATEACPNEALRSGLSAALPDCRAYEQVTPANKDYGYGGLPGQPIPPVAIGSLDGGSAVYDSGGPLPGAGSGPFIGFYRADRGAGGWESRSISAPQAPVAGLGGVHPAFLGFSPDLTKALTVTVNPPLTPEAPPDVPSLYLQSGSGPPYALLTPAGADDFVEYAGASADYSRFFYDTFVPQTPEAPPEEGASNSQLYEYSDGTVRIVGILPDGSIAPDAKAAASSTEQGKSVGVAHVVSADGSRVYFTHTNGALQLYLRLNPDQPQSPLDGEGNCTVPADACTIEVSASQATAPDPNGPKPASFWAASADGSEVFFTSPSELTDDANTGEEGSGPTDAGADLYRYDLASGVLSDLSVDTNPTDAATGAAVQGVAGASDDGSYVYFVADGDLGGGGVSGQPNLYLSHGGTTTFIASLDPTADEGDWSSSALQSTARVTPDGHHLAFTSVESPTGFDNTDAVSGQPDSEVYLYDATSEQLTCASCDPSEARPTGPSRIAPMNVPSSSFNQPRNLSTDGRHLFFDSRDSLTPRDTNDHQDVYMFEDGRPQLISSGSGDFDARFGDASPNGDDVLFGTAEQLVPQDEDGVTDLYDARAGGGFPVPAQPAPCSGEACRAVGAGPAAPPPPASSTLSGPGNVKPRHRHRRHRRHRHHHRHRKAHRGWHSPGGAASSQPSGRSQGKERAR